MGDQREGRRVNFGELPDDGALTWTITQALLAASDATTRALELHLSHTQYHDRGGAETESPKQYIDDAIDYHEQILEDLRLARDGLDYERTP